jgi:crotonobetainyl-CoA:carnitine CoA-transferase CaiB-like acyl-CoA transferase
MLLQGYKVVELATYIAGPAACCMMGDWGADVVKIEALTGDPIRFVRPPYDPELPDIPPNFEIDNHGKKSIALDISRPEGRQIVEELLADADVFVTSFREGSLARAGLGFEAMRTLNPRLVCANVSGYGLRGPGAEMNAFDLTAFWSRSGLALQGFPPDSLPANVRPGWGDHITAVTLALGIMTALLERAKTGEGRVVEASLLTAALYVGSYDIVEFLRRGQLMPNLSRAASDVAAFYQSQDGRWFSFFPRNPERDWATIFTAANRLDLIGDPRFTTAQGRGDHARELKEALDAGFGRTSIAAIGETFTDGGVTWSLLNTIPEAVEDPLVAASGSFIEFDDRRGGTLRTPGAPVRFPGADLHPPGSAPTIGEHTEDVLRHLGRDDAAIAALRRAGVIR